MLRDVSAKNCRAAEHPISLVTANGSTEANEVADVKLSALPDPVHPYVLDHTPGCALCRNEMCRSGLQFVWPANGKPILVRPDDKVVQLKIEGHVPILDDSCKVYPKDQFQKDKHLKSCFKCRPHGRAQKPSGTKPKMKSSWMSWWRMTLSRSTSEAARLRICWLKLQVPNISTRISPRTPFAELANEQG